MKLVSKVCDTEHARFLAAGSLVFAYALAQEEAGVDNPRALIPLEKWTKRGLPEEIIICGLATIEGEHVYVRGAETMLSFKSRRGISGRLGGQATASKRKQNQANASKSNPLTLSLPLSLTEENTGGEGAPPIFEKVWEGIPLAAREMWANKWTPSSVLSVAHDAYVAYLAKPDDTRPIASFIVDWIRREKRKLVARAPVIVRSTSEPMNVPPPTPEEVREAAQVAEARGLKLATRALNSLPGY